MKRSNRGPYLDLHGGWSQGGDLLLHAVSDTRVHGGTTGQHVVGVQVLADINVALHDAVVGGLMDTGGLHSWGAHQITIHLDKSHVTAAHIIRVKCTQIYI